VVGCNTPWARFAFGYPGKMSLGGFPGGARTYALFLVVPALAGLTRWAGRRSAAIAGSFGVLAVSAANLVGLAKQGGGLAAVAYGASALAGLGVIGWLHALYLRHRAVTLTASALAAVAFPFTQGGEAQWIRVFASIGIFATAAIGLNVVVGLAGLLDLGYIA